MKIPPFDASWIEAPPFEAMPVSEIHSAAEELFWTRKPFAGAAPPNRVCAEPPAASVPLPSLAAVPAVLTTGSGFCGPTGAAMPCAFVEAGACAGTRLPLPSVTVESDCTVVLASFTRSVIGPPYDSQRGSETARCTAAQRPKLSYREGRNGYAKDAKA